MKLEEILPNIRKNKIKEVQLSGEKIGDKGAKLLATALGKNQSVTGINLEANQLTVEGVLDLAQVLVKHSSLATINLACNPIKDEGVKIIAQLLEKNNYIVAMVLELNQITDVGAQRLIKALEKNRTITFLALDGNLIDSQLQEQISSLLTRNYDGLVELFNAAQQKNIAVIREKISEGINPNIQDDKGDTVLHIAARNGDVELLEYLFSIKVDKTIQNRDGKIVSDLISPEAKEILKRRIREKKSDILSLFFNPPEIEDSTTETERAKKDFSPK